MIVYAAGVGGLLYLAKQSTDPGATAVVTALSITLALSCITILLSTTVMVTGFIGVCRLSLKALYLYAALSIVLFVFGLVNTVKYSFDMNLLIPAGIILMTILLIKELRRENGF